MSKKNKKLYKQCQISRGRARWTAWVPVGLAIEGKTIVPKGFDPATVEKVFKTTLTHKQLFEYYGTDEEMIFE